MVSTDKIMRGLVSFLDNEVLSNLPAKGWQRPVCGTFLAVASQRLDGIIDSLKSNQMLLAIGVFNESGSVDLETLKREFSKQLGSEGMTIEFPLIGPITFHSSDVDTLYNYILNA